MTNQAAQELGRLGGKATAAKRTPTERRESARKAARARWDAVNESKAKEADHAPEPDLP